MKIVIIHGQSHKGSTCMVARELAAKVGGELREFFLPRDFHQSCMGCYTCFQTDLSHCPHYNELEPLVTAILEADLLILASPVYVYHATGPMMSFLDHFGTWWVVHRPLADMSRKQAVAIATAAGGGMKAPCGIWLTAWKCGASARSISWVLGCRQRSLTKFRTGFAKPSTQRQTGWRVKSAKTQASAAATDGQKSGFI